MHYRQQIMKITAVAYFIALLVFCFISSVLGALNFGGVIDSPKVAMLWTIPSMCLGFVAYVLFVINMNIRKNSYNLTTKVVLFILSIPCLFFLISNAAVVYDYIK